MAKEDPKKLLKEVGAEALSIQESINSISGALNKNIKELNQVTGDTQKIFNSTLSTSTNLGKKLAEINENSIKSSKERKSLEDQLVKNAKEISSLEKQRDQFMKKAQTARGAEQRSLLKIANLLGDAVDYSKEQVANAEKLTKAYVDIEKNLGITGKLLDGINKIPILNKFIDTRKALEAANEEAAKFTGNRWNVLGAALKSLGSSLKKNLTDPLVLIGAAGGILSKIISLFKEFDERSVKIARSYGTTAESSRETAKELAHIAAHSSNILSTTGNLTESFNDLNAVAGTYANFSQETLENYNDLVKGFGLSKEATITQYKFSVLQGKSFKEISSQLFAQVSLQKSQNKLALSDKEIFESISKTTARQRLNIKGGTEELVKSVINVKKLGAEFADLANISQSLLNFEDSIGSELEAELLTGKQLNLERARAAALSGNQADLAAEITKQIGTSEQFGKMNVIQQESLAKAFGLSADRMAEMLENQEMLNAANRLGAKDANDLAAQYAKAADKEAFLAKLGDEKLKAQVQNITFQEKLNNLLEKFKEVFVTQLEPIFIKVLNKFDEFIKGGGIKKIAETAKSIGSVFVSIGKALTGPIGKALGLLAGIGALRMLATGLPVRIVGSGPMGGAGGGTGGGMFGSLFTTKNVGGQFKKGGGRYAAGATKITGLSKMGMGVAGMAGGALANMAGGALTDAGYGTAGGALEMGGQGLMLGSMFGPVGMLIGGLGGAILGGIKGHYEQEAKDRKKEQDKRNIATSRPIMDFKRRLEATTNQDARYEALTGHGEVDGTEKTNMLLEKLVNISEQGGNINIDGNKAGTYQARAIYQLT